jgi:probable rRNA maturation factor
VHVRIGQSAVALLCSVGAVDTREILHPGAVTAKPILYSTAMGKYSQAMIVIEPANLLATLAEPSGGAARLRKRELSSFLAAAAEAVGLQGQISVLLTDDSGIRELNRQFRRIDKATDVLSFPSAEPAGGPPLAGDLAISLETACRQAHGFQHELATEVKVLMLHGVLHLAGLDHESDSGQMARREGILRRRFDLPSGLIQRTVGAKAVTAKKNSPRERAPRKRAAKP